MRDLYHDRYSEDKMVLCDKIIPKETDSPRSDRVDWNPLACPLVSAMESEATEEALRMLEVYRAFAEETLAIPVVTGAKSASERFAGAVDTYTIEAMMQNGWALQSGTSHFLGQNFAKAFDVTYQTQEGDLEFVWATSWGVSTRMVGGMVMTHGDDQGIVVPPRLAPVQVVIVPIMNGSHMPQFSESEWCSACHEYAQPALHPDQSLDAERWPDGIPVFETWSPIPPPSRLPLEVCLRQGPGCRSFYLATAGGRIQ